MAKQIVKDCMLNCCKKIHAPRFQNFMAAMICAAVMIFALYTQYFQHQDPCPLCIFQRIFYLLSGSFFLLAAIFNPQKTGLKIYAATSGLFSLAGALIAGRQIWIQHLPPDQIPSCLPDLASLFHYLPANQVISLVLKGSGDCSIVSWRLLGLSMPEWSLLFFVLLCGISLANFISSPNKKC